MYSSQIRIGRIRTSRREITDITKAWAVLSLAFAILLGGTASIAKLFVSFLFSAVTIGIAFLFHEIAHKLTAQHYGCFAEFRSFDGMLFLALVMSFFGFIFAAPGAVFISGPVGRRRNGMISAAGPLTNLLLALVFLATIYVFGLNLLNQYGFMINSWLALFNLIPFGGFDGVKILKWNKAVYGSMALAAVAFLIVQGVL